MARLLAGQPGGIAGLVDLIDRHSEAIESDLIDRGLRLRWLGTPEFNWRDLKVIVSKLPETSALVRELAPDSKWGLPEQLLAELVDTVHWLQWTKTKAANSKAPHGQPDPIPRPGVKPKTETIKFDVLPADDMLDWLGWESEMTEEATGHPVSPEPPKKPREAALNSGRIKRGGLGVPNHKEV